MATPLKFASAYPVSRVGGTGGSGFAVGALEHPHHLGIYRVKYVNFGVLL